MKSKLIPINVFKVFDYSPGGAPQGGQQSCQGSRNARSETLKNRVAVVRRHRRERKRVCVPFFRQQYSYYLLYFAETCMRIKQTVQSNNHQFLGDTFSRNFALHEKLNFCSCNQFHTCRAASDTPDFLILANFYEL